MSDKLKVCPFCGGLLGFYRICHIKGETEMHHNFPGTIIVSPGIVGCTGPFDTNEVDNSHIHEDLEYRENKTAFCIECRRAIRKGL